MESVLVFLFISICIAACVGMVVYAHVQQNKIDRDFSQSEYTKNPEDTMLEAKSLFDPKIKKMLDIKNKQLKTAAEIAMVRSRPQHNFEFVCYGKGFDKDLMLIIGGFLLWTILKPRKK